MQQGGQNDRINYFLCLLGMDLARANLRILLLEEVGLRYVPHNCRSVCGDIYFIKYPVFLGIFYERMWVRMLQSEIQIRRECDIEILRWSELDLTHRLDEFSECGTLSDASIVCFLFSDGRHHLSRVVMSWIDTRRIRESVDLSHDRMIESLGRSSLEVSTTCLADEEGIPSEEHIAHEETRTSICMSRCRECFDFDTSDIQSLSIREEDIGFYYSSSFAKSDLGSSFFSQKPRTSDMIRMDMGIEDIYECESEL